MKYKQLATYSLLDFATELQASFEEGYRLDTEVFTHVPQQIGSLFTTTLVLKEEVVEEVKEEVVDTEPLQQEELPKETTVPKLGRKKQV